MYMKNTLKWFLPVLLILVVMTAATVHPQISLDEQNAIIDAVVQTMNPENMKATVAAEVKADLINKFYDAGYVGLAAALTDPSEDSNEFQQAPTQTATSTPDMLVNPNSIEQSDSTTPTPAITPTRLIETSIADYYDGAILQEDGTYRGLHAKFVHSYAYAVGSFDENGQIREYSNAFTPNKWFNVDVVFENDGSLVWPPRIEMRHTGNVGEYTGTESVTIDRTDNPILPGQKAGFTISAYGSENLGWTTFFFQLYDADSGSVIEGGQGSFTYNAY